MNCPACGEGNRIVEITIQRDQDRIFVCSRCGKWFKAPRGEKLRPEESSP